MAKLTKQYYYNKEHEKKVNCYHINLSKEIVKESMINEDDELVIYSDYDRIIIEKKYHCVCMGCGYEWESGTKDELCDMCPKCVTGDIHYDINGGSNDNHKQGSKKDA